MDLTLSEDERVLQDSIGQTLQAEATTELIRKVEQGRGDAERQALWRKLAELGYLGLPVSEGHGGTGGTLVDLALLLEQAGRVCVPGPLIDTVVASVILDEHGQRPEALKALVDGDALASIGWSESEADRLEHLELSAGSDGKLRGRKISLPFGGDSRYLVAFGKNAAGSPAVFLLDLEQPGVKRSAREVVSEDPTVDVEIVDYPADILSEDAAQVVRWRDLLFTANAAYATGVCDRLQEISIDYAKNREQFGHPIGSYQAIQHRCVEMASLSHGTRYLTYQAAFLLGKGRSASLESAMASYYGALAIEKCTRHAHQIHAAIGFSREIDLQLFTRRAKNLQVQIGGQIARQEDIAAEIGAQPTA